MCCGPPAASGSVLLDPNGSWLEIEMNTRTSLETLHIRRLFWNLSASDLLPKWACWCLRSGCQHSLRLGCFCFQNKERISVALCLELLPGSRPSAPSFLKDIILVTPKGAFPALAAHSFPVAVVSSWADLKPPFTHRKPFLLICLPLGLRQVQVMVADSLRTGSSEQIPSACSQVSGPPSFEQLCAHVAQGGVGGTGSGPRVLARGGAGPGEWVRRRRLSVYIRGRKAHFFNLPSYAHFIHQGIWSSLKWRH